MRVFPSIFAMLMALLVAWPACCCAAAAPEAKTCCSAPASQDPGEGEEPHDCPCQMADVLEPFHKSVAPAVAFAAPIPDVERATLPLPPAPQCLPVAAIPHTGCDPPRLLLARYSRWLI